MWRKMISDCLLSIIVVALNEEKRLPTLLKSISNEASNNDIQVIMIDNGSTDRTYKVMQEYAGAHKNVKVAIIRGPLGHAWNEALKMADCEYVMFLGADMYLPRGWYERIRKLLSRGRYDAVVARLIPLFRYQGPLNNYDLAYFLGDTASDGPWREPTFHSGGLIVRRDAALKVGFKPLPTSEDGEFSFRFLRAGYHAYYFPSQHYVFDEHYYDVKTMMSYYRKLGTSLIVLIRSTGALSVLKMMIRTVMEPLTPHYLITRYRKARKYVPIKYTTWITAGLLRIYAILTSIILHTILLKPIPTKIIRTKL